MSAPEKKPFHLALAEKLIEQIKQNTAPWQKPWAPGQTYLPYNPTTGNRYKGINSIQLLSEERADLRWLTYKQAQAEGGQVRRGEKGTVIQFWKFEEEREVKDAGGKPVRNAAKQTQKQTTRLDQPRVFLATVFNAEQIDGLPPLEKKPVTWDTHAAAEARLALATIKHGPGDKAYYRRADDTIQLPQRSQFADALKYYHVGLHELAHWTGHPNRMNREGGNPFGSPEYAREELRAEISSLLMGEEIGIGHSPGRNSAAYLQSWAQALEEQPLEIFRAAAEAEKIRTYIAEQVAERERPGQPNPQTPPTVSPTMEPLPVQPQKQTEPPAPPKSRRSPVASTPEKIYLAVPYGEKNAAKALGARWDAERKAWYAASPQDAAKLERWLPERQAMASAAGQGSALAPRDEFAAAVARLGMQMVDGHPHLDGKPHRVSVEGDRPGEAAGFYVLYGDGHPAGYAKNNRTGEEVRWKAKGYTLSDEERSALAAEAALRMQAREQQTREGQAEAAARVEQQLRGAKPARSTPYLAGKQITATKGIFADKEDKTLLIPGYDADGKVWTAQYIQEDGTKRFAKGARKEGCFHVIGGMAELSKASVVIVAEGYATANVIAEAAGKRAAVVSAFDAGNLEPVARVLKERFPDKPMLVAGDDDRAEPGRNPGREHATRAAEAVGAKVILPTFATGEQRRDPKRFSDFADLKVHSRLGTDGLKEQIEAAVEKTLEGAEQDQETLAARKEPVPAKARTGRRDGASR